MYRDELEAARAKAEALERENQELKDKLKQQSGPTKIEVVRDPKDPRKGFILLEVLSPSMETGRGVWEAIEPVLGAYFQLFELEEQLLSAVAQATQQYKQLNALTDAEVEALATSQKISKKEALQAKERVGQSIIQGTQRLDMMKEKKTEALRFLLSNARQICSPCVVGYQAELLYPGQESFYPSEDGGLASAVLDWLEVGGYSIQTALQVLRLSSRKPALTKEEQWGDPNRAYTL